MNLRPSWVMVKVLVSWERAISSCSWSKWAVGSKPWSIRCAFGGAKGRRDVPRIVDWYMDGKIQIDDLITHVMPIEKVNDAFDLMHEGKSIRSVVTF